MRKSLPVLRSFRAATLGISAVALVAAELGAQQVERVAPGVREAVESLPPGGSIPVIVEFETTAPAVLAPGAEGAEGVEDAEGIERLKSRASFALRGLEAVVAAAPAADLRVSERFWIVPAAAAEVTAAGLERLAAAPGVRRIFSDEPLPVQLDPVRRSFAPPSFTSDAMRTIGADAVWDDGATGAGVVVALFDSGVDVDNAMVGSRWRGHRTPTRASWFDPFYRASEPEDRIGHGTQVAVAAVGALAAGDTLELADGTTIVASSDLDVVTGTAPRAEWIAARVFDNFGGGVFSRRSVLLQAFQWALDPDGNPATDDAPDVINNSWGAVLSEGFATCDDIVYDAIDAAEAAGIAVLFAAGNTGPGSGSVAFPAARDDANLRSFAVGASAGTTTITVAGYSGRGPSPCGGAIKPELVAPGAVPEVRFDGSGRARLTGFVIQGTSFSVAQASGAVALVRQARPGAGPEAAKRFLIDNAEDIGASGPDNAAGFGLLDVPAALTDAGAAVRGDLLQIAGAVLDESGLTVRLRNRGAEPWPGGSLRVEWEVRPERPAASASLPSIGPGETLAATLALSGTPPAEGEPVRVVVTDAGGDALSRLVWAGPPDAFGGFVLTAGDLAAGANDFGRLGQIAAGQGFVWQGEELLPAGGIGVAAGGIVSDGFYATTLGRADLKRFPPAAETDWAPVRILTDVQTAAAEVRFDDFEALVPVGLEVNARYEASDSGGVGALGVVLSIRNRSGQPIPDLVAGLLADWDLAGGEHVRWSPELEALVAEAVAGTGGAGPLTVLASDTTVSTMVELPLGTPESSGFYAPGSGVLADSLVDEVKLDLLRGGSAGSLPGAGTATDNAALLGVGPFALPAGQVVTLRFWLLAAPDEPAAAARLAELRSEVIPPPGGEGERFAAEPPFPNPFRVGEGIVRFPYTLSGADVAAGGNMALEIYDLSGRRLYRQRRVLAPSGAPPEFTWDGRLGDGRQAAGGMYLYVIRLDERSVSGRVLVR